MDSTIFRGCVPALMTPCSADRTPNHVALVNKAQELIAAGMNGVVYCGSMGDWPLLSDEQRQEGVRQLADAGVPVIVGTERLVAMGEVPGGTRSNLESAARWTSWDDAVPADKRLVLADAQTSGGLLAAVRRDCVSGLLVDLEEAGTSAAVVGSIQGWGDGCLEVRNSPPTDRYLN